MTGSAPYRAQLDAAARVCLSAPSDDVTELAATLYSRWFAPPIDEPVPALHPDGWLARYRAADAASGRFEAGWIVVDLPGSLRSPWQVAATRGRELRCVDPGDYLHPGATGVRPAPGAAIAVTARRDYEFDGWWSTASAGWKPEPDVLRVYWSVRPPHACTLIESLTTALDFDAPWALKAPVISDRLLRADALVLYIGASGWDGLRPAIGDVSEQLARCLRDELPALVLAVAPGVGLAEDPGEESFGTHRCGVIAEGIRARLRRGERRADRLADAAEAALADHGISVAAPYLNAGSGGRYGVAAS